MENNTVKIEKQRINFRCKINNCSKSCCGVFAGITSNLFNIETRPFEEIVLTDDDYKKIYNNGYVDLIDEDGYSKHMNKHYKKMALNKDGSCRAFVNGKCRINKIKPTLCIAFPFYFDMFTGLCAVKCEGFSDNDWTELNDHKESFDAARKMYEFWIDFYTERNVK